jgi:hypothetical protein
MKYSTVLLLLSLASPAAAGDYPDVVARPSDEVIANALRTAYRLNDNSMVGSRMIDLTDTGTQARAALLSDIIPDSGPGVWPKLEQPKPVKKAEADICTRHGMRKSIRGKSWRCAR